METRSGRDEDPVSTPETHEPWDERAEQLRGLASRHGLRYLSRYPSEDPFGIKDAPFRWLKRRLRPKLSNVLIGSYRATEIVAFDFALDGLVLGGSEYSAGYSNYGVTATCALAKIPWSAPRLTLTPWTDKGLLRRYVHLGGVKLGDPRFRRIFHVTTRDRPFARALLQPKIRDQLLIPARDTRHLRPDEPTAVAVEIRGHWIACSSPLLDPEHVDILMLEPLTAIADGIPAAVSAVPGPYRPLR